MSPARDDEDTRTHLTRLSNDIAGVRIALQASDRRHEARFAEVEERQTKTSLGIDALRSAQDKADGSRTTWRFVWSAAAVVAFAYVSWLSVTLIGAAAVADQNSIAIERIEGDSDRIDDKLDDVTAAVARMSGQLDELIQRMSRRAGPRPAED